MAQLLKKIGLMFIAILLIFGAIPQVQASEEIFEPGTYTGVGNGRNGEVKVEVTFDEERIVAAEVVEQHETDGLSDAVFKDLPKSVIENQSLAVDVVSGASDSSNAVIEAIRDAIEQAGANPDDFYQEVEKLAEEDIELSTQLVVVGGGAAGISSALRADELGLDVILLEKQSFIGGAISISGGNQVVMGSKLQVEAGVSDDSVESLIDDFKANGNNKNDEDLLKLFAKNVGSTTDWLNDYVGIKYNMEDGLHVLAEYSHNRELAYDGGGQGFAETARAKVEESNIDLHLNTRANKLIVEAGKVVGVEAETTAGGKVIIHSDAVILATGGYGYNEELLTDELKQVLYYGPVSSTGDGILMATDEAVNAETQNMEYGKTYPNGIEVSEGIAKSTIGGNLIVLKENGILVNSLGERVVNERASNKDILEVELSQSDKMLYLLLDQVAFDKFKAGVAEGGISEEDINNWLENNGSETPYFYHADTLEELAEVADMKKEALTNTVDRFNELVEKGKDEDFGRPDEFFKTKVGDGPYYLIEQKPRFATTMGGLVADTQLQILDENGEPISGLLGAGETVGGVMGTDSPSGANNAWALTSGKLAAETVANILSE